MFVRGCEKFVPALAYLFCLALAGSCLARFAYFFADLCTVCGWVRWVPAAQRKEVSEWYVDAERKTRAPNYESFNITAALRPSDFSIPLFPALVLAVAEVARRPRPSFANISRVHIYLQGDHDFKFNSIRVPYGQTVPC